MVEVGASGSQRKAHTFRSVELKRQIVEETLKAGSSVSSVARAHGINANQVFQWRKLYQEGALEPASGLGRMRLLPVTVSDEAEQEATPLPKSSRGASCPGFIELRFEWGQLRIEGAVEDVTLRTVLGCLLT